MTASVLSLTEALIARDSVTPRDAGCLDLIRGRLEPLGFRAEPMRFGEVDNLWLRRGTGHPLFVFAGHTDVVPPGPLNAWHTPPFTPTVRDGILYGRGAADMKGSLAAMVVACEEFVIAHPDHRGSVALLLTSDEEGPAVDGTVRVVEALTQRGETIDWCLVGEPSSAREVGDVIKNGRRGSLSATLQVLGRQGHVAYPHLAENPIHGVAPALAELSTTEWDRGNRFFPPTSFQISNIHAGTGAGNVIPGNVEIHFNFRYATASSAEDLKARVHEVLVRHGLRYSLEWTHSGRPFLTPEGELVTHSQSAVMEVTGHDCELSTSGGTSDGRFIAPTGAEVVELGPVNGSIHQVDEHVRVEELETLARIYRRILERLLSA